MSHPTPREVLYALVAAGFHIVVLVLVIGSAAAGLTPVWWNVLIGALLAVSAVWVGVNWRRTPAVLASSVGLLIAWAVGTLLSS